MSRKSQSETQQVAGPCSAVAIEYKAYARSLEKGAAAIHLVASCYYPRTGITIFFDGYHLMQQVATGRFMHHTNFCIASWTTPLPLSDPPNEVRITDAFGEHQVRVAPWN
jgi:hypothetical protein